ncbi:MAG: murein biosynthesis integral membrane protein MurJ [Bdellovibrionota bacterium]
MAKHPPKPPGSSHPDPNVASDPAVPVQPLPDTAAMPEAVINPDTSVKQSSVLKNALAMAAGTFASRILGLVREVAFAALFTRTVTDAWMAAFRLPNLFRRLLGEGSLAVSFIPVFVDAHSDNETRTRNLVNGFYTALLIILTVLTTLGIVFSREVLLVLLDPEYMLVPGKFEMTVRLAQIMFGFIFLMSTFAFYMGILNALGHFTLPAIAPTLFNVAMIISTLIPGTYFPSPGDGLAWGVLVGGALQMGILIPELRRRGYFPKLTTKLWSKDIQMVFRNMGPGMIGLGLLQVTTLVNMRFATRFGEGALSYISWADRLLELPLSLISVSLGTALLPMLSKLWTNKDKEKFSETSEHYLKLNLVMGVFCAAVLYCYALPIVEILFQRGRFTPADSQATADVVRIYSLVLIPASCVRVLAPSYYAVKNTWFPAVVAFISLASHLIAAPLLMDMYGLPGLNLSSSLSATVNAICLLVGFQLMITKFRLGSLMMTLIKVMVATAPVFLVAETYKWILPDSFFTKVLVLAMLGTLSAAGFILAGKALGVNEVWDILQRLRRRLLKK